MSGLVVKDLLVLRKAAKTYLVVLAIYGAMTLSGLWSPDLFAGIMAMMVMMLPINAFSWDNYTKWDDFCLALPVSRRQVVGARYWVVAAALVAAFVLSLLMGGALWAMGQLGDGMEYLLSVTGAVLGGALMNGVTLPIIYKVGPEKGRVAMFGTFGCLLAAIFLLGKGGAFQGLNQLPEPSRGQMALCVAIMLAGALLVLALSFALSCRIYGRKK